VTVKQSPLSNPASSSSRSTTWTPPMRSMSTMWYLPCGLVSAMWGTLAAMWLKSSSSSSTCDSCAMASRCRTAFVEPPSALTTAMAFSKAGFVMICRGRIPASSSPTTARPESKAKSSRRRSTAGAAELPGRHMPSASAADAIVLAVNIPAHEPSVGQARFSISPSSFSVIVPAAHAPMASNTLTTSRAWSFQWPGRIDPP
jgi:hypothetical protein